MSAWNDLLRDLDAHRARKAHEATARREAHVPIARPLTKAIATPTPQRLSLFDRAQAGLKLMSRDHGQ